MKNTTSDSAAPEPAEQKSTSAPAEYHTAPVDSPAPSSRRTFRTPVIVGAAAGALVVGAALGGVGGFAIGDSGAGHLDAGSNSQFPGGQGGPGQQGGTGGPPGQGQGQGQGSGSGSTTQTN
jgi:hypothetical protein